MIKKAMRAAATPLLSTLNPRPPAQYPDWASILRPDSDRWKSARVAAENGPKVLIANSAGIRHDVTTIDSLLAVALTLRGAEVHILVCDEALPACAASHNKKIDIERFAACGPSEDLCGQCFLNGSKVFRSLGLKVHRLSDYISSEDLKRATALSETVPLGEIDTFRLEGMAIGEHALAGALRYFARGNLKGERHGEAILRRYFHASLLSMFAIRRLLNSFSFRSVCGLHGVYVPDGLLSEVARNLKVRSVHWNEAYRKQTFIFSHYDTYHRTMLSEPMANWESMPWTEEMESAILGYLKSRWYGTHDWIGYTQDWSEDVLAIAAELGIDFNKPCVGLLTNVIWDAQVYYGGNAFSNMLEWTLKSIEYFAKRPDLQLIVRVHPAEVRGALGSRQLMVDEIKQAFPTLPKNIFVIPPDSPLNTYAAMLKCNAVIIYGTKAGVELSSFGIPVIVAGEAWIRNKGVTLDASSAPEYYDLLDRLPFSDRMTDAAVQQARKYAYHYFFRRLIPLPFLTKGTGDALFKLGISGVDDLMPGRYPGLDVICNGILKGDEFIYPAELHPNSVAETGKFTTNYSVKLTASQGSKPVVSVIVPVRESAAFLAEALECIHKQDGAGDQFDVDAVVVDGASSDNTSEALCIRQGARYIRGHRNANASQLLNLGIEASKGQYLAFLEEGDDWRAERLRVHLAILKNNPQFGAVYGQFISNGSRKDLLCPDAASAPSGSVFRPFLSEDFVCPSFLTVRREALQKAGYFDETLGATTHYDMTLRLAFAVQFAFVSGPSGMGRTSKQRLAPGAANVPDYNHSELADVLNKAIALLPGTPEFQTLRETVFSRWFAEIARRLDSPETADLLRSHVLYWLKQNPWLMKDPAYRESTLAYASKTLTHALQRRSGLIPPAIRGFCNDVKNAQNGNGHHEFPMRRFLGDMLTQTARKMWEQGDLKAAGYAATYAVRQDFTQIVRQVGKASKSFVRTLLPT